MVYPPQHHLLSRSTGQRAVSNEAAYLQNASSSANGLHGPIPQQQPMVVIPPISIESRQSDYVTIEEPSQKHEITASRKRKRETELLTGEGISSTKDQRVVSDDILHQLKTLIRDIFEAYEQSGPDKSDIVSSTGTQLFVSIHLDEGEIATLTPAVHVKMESLIQRVINLGRLGEIPMDDLQRLQGFCEGALTSVESLDLHDNRNTDDLTHCVQHLGTVDGGLRSARTIVRMMTGVHEQRVICSEELLQRLVSMVRKVLHGYIIPIVEARSDGPSSVPYEAAMSHKKVVSQLCYDVTIVMGLLTELLSKTDMADHIITSIEYMATSLIFVENAHNEKESFLGVQKFESLRRTAMDMIAVIFARYQEQRLSIFDEILSSLQKLTVSRQHARQFKLADGKSIQLVSALIIRLVQESATTSTAATERVGSRSLSQCEEELGSKSSFERDNSRSRDSENGVDYLNDSSTIEISCQPITQRLYKDASFLFKNAAKNAQYVVNYLISRASTASKTGDQPHRQLLEIFVEDLIMVLGLPEWPGAELILWVLSASCRNIAETPKCAAPAKNMALELLGMMGSAITELVSSTRHAVKTFENHDSTFSGYLRQMLDDYMDGSLESKEVVMWDGPFHAVIDYLKSHSSDNSRIGSAQRFCLTRWARVVSSGDSDTKGKTEDLALKLHKMLSGAEWFTSE